jgi:hypothetical protein
LLTYNIKSSETEKEEKERKERKKNREPKKSTGEMVYSPTMNKTST